MDLLIHGKRPYKLLHSDQRDKTKRGLSSAVRGCTAAVSIPHSSRKHFFRADISSRVSEGWQREICVTSHLSAPQQAEPMDDFWKQIGKTLLDISITAAETPSTASRWLTQGCSHQVGGTQRLLPPNTAPATPPGSPHCGTVPLVRCGTYPLGLSSPNPVKLH